MHTTQRHLDSRPGPVRWLLIAAAAIMITAAAGCGSHGATSAAGSTTVHAAASTLAGRPAATHPAASQPATPHPGAPQAAGATKTCPAGDVSASIGGAAKCLTAGQQCESQHVADYPRYGFTCAQTNGRYVLQKRTT